MVLIWYDNFAYSFQSDKVVLSNLTLMSATLDFKSRQAVRVIFIGKLEQKKRVTIVWVRRDPCHYNSSKNCLKFFYSKFPIFSIKEYMECYEPGVTVC